MYGYTVVNSFPHDPGAFTQGLIFRDGVLFESTGHNGKSSVRKVKLETGEVLQRYDVDARYFAEGLTDWGNRLIQLTYTTKVGFVYDLASFALQRTFTYTGEGWGLTHDARRLIMSDGTAGPPLSRSRDAARDRTHRRQGRRQADRQSQRARAGEGRGLRQRLD